MSTIYFSVDIETNGLCAGIHSMISLGCAAVDVETGKLVGTFKANLTPLPDLQVDIDTMNWWATERDAYRRATTNSVHPQLAMNVFKAWVEQVSAKFGVERPVAAAWKPGFDLAFLRYYLFRFCGGDIFGRAGSGLDIKTLTAAALNQPFSETQIANVPAVLKGTGAEHSHDALEDAVEQANVLVRARRLLGVQV